MSLFKSFLVLAALMIGLQASPASLHAADVSPPPIAPRSSWMLPGAPFAPARMEKHKVGKYEIIIHHTGTLTYLWRKKSAKEKMRDYHADHLTKTQRYRTIAGLKGQKWGGFAYHYLIDTDGTVSEGRDVQYLGDSGTDYDLSNRLLVVLHGDFEGTPIESTGRGCRSSKESTRAHRRTYPANPPG